MLDFLLRKLAAWLIGPGLGMSDEKLDGITLAIDEEAKRLGVNP